MLLRVLGHSNSDHMATPVIGGVGTTRGDDRAIKNSEVSRPREHVEDGLDR